MSINLIHSTRRSSSGGGGSSSSSSSLSSSTSSSSSPILLQETSHLEHSFLLDNNNNNNNNTGTANSSSSTGSRQQHHQHQQHLTFGHAMSTRLNWTIYDEYTAPTKNNHHPAGILEFARHVYQLAFVFAVMEPVVPINTNSTCRQPAVLKKPAVSSWMLAMASSSSSSLSSECAPNTVSNGFTGRVLEQPRKVGHAIQFGFDVDTLEILLRELYDVVDKFFIIEWTLPHNQRFKPKQLGWEAVKGQARFAFCADKVVHILMDDIDAAYVDPTEGWSAEDLQETRRWQKIVEWNNLTGYFGDDDLIGFGDADEIPSRKNVHLLKYCEWNRPLQTDVGIWFPMGRIDQAFRTDYPIGTYRYSLGDPTFHTFQSAHATYKYKKKAPTRNRGTSFYWIFGGAHFSHYGYLVYQVLKQMSCTECDVSNFQTILSKLRSAVDTGKWHELELEASEPLPNWKERIVPLKMMERGEREKVVYIPWFYDCNRDRYSMWEGRPDGRTAVIRD